MEDRVWGVGLRVEDLNVATEDVLFVRSVWLGAVLCAVVSGLGFGVGG